MRRFYWPVLLLSVRVLCGQGMADGCNSALDSLNRFKERFFTDAASVDFKREHSTLITATRNCPGSGELWYYKALLGKRAGALESETNHALSKAKELKWSKAAEQDWADFKPSTTAANASLAGSPENKWALVVGVGKFADKSLRDLSSAQDATALRNLLVDPDAGRFPASNVHLLVNEKAKVESIRLEVGWLRQNAKPNDLVLVYFASHGIKRDVDPNGVSYIAAYNSDLSNPATVYATSIQMIDLVTDLTRELQSLRVVLILDTCYSGDAASGAGREAVSSLNVSQTADFSEALRLFRAGAGRAVLTAATADQESYQGEKIGHGYFTYFLLKALRESAGNMPLAALYQRIKTETQSAVLKEYGKTQTPLMIAGASAGEISIGAPAGAAR